MHGLHRSLTRNPMERLTISLDDELAQEFDDWLAQRGHTHRSEAMRDGR